MSLTSSEPELDEAQRLQLAWIRRGTMIALICACAGFVFCFLFIFQIIAIVLGVLILWRIQQTGVGTEYRMRAIVAIMIAVLALILILIPILNPNMRMTWPT